MCVVYLYAFGPPQPWNQILVFGEARIRVRICIRSLKSPKQMWAELKTFITYKDDKNKFK